MKDKTLPVPDINLIISQLVDGWSKEHDKRIRYDTIGYNGGQSRTGLVQTPEHKESLRLAREAGWHHTEATKEKLRQLNNGRVYSEATIEKMRLAKKGKKLTEEHKRKIGLAGEGRKPSEESKRKSALSNRGKRGKKISIHGVIYDSVGEAQRTIGVDRSDISKRASSQLEKWKDYFFVEDGPQTSFIDPREKTFILIDPDGVEHSGYTVEEFCREHPEIGHPGSVRQLLRGKWSQMNGWTGYWIKKRERVGSIPSHLLRSLSVNGVRYPSINEAERQLGIPATTLRHRIKNTDDKWKDYFYIDPKRKTSN